jgi:hypothetical protein
MQRLLAMLLLSGAATSSLGATLHEDFANDPGRRGWRTFGEAALFLWNSGSESLDVTWDSSKPNSYFYRPLGTVLSKSDELTLSFDLRLPEFAVGTTPGKPFTFELAVGLINWRNATSTNFLRGTGAHSPNLLELDWFPDSGFGATLSPVMVSSNGQFAVSHTVPFELNPDNVYHFSLRYSAASQTLTTAVRINDGPSMPARDVVLTPAFTDFRLDTLAVSSYTDQGAGGSILARGTIDNLQLIYPNPPLPAMRGGLDAGAWQVVLAGAQGWLHTLERTEDWREWQTVSASHWGTGGELLLRDESAAALPQAAFYRVRLERP